MSWRSCFGRKCKLGWGYNESYFRLIPVEGTPCNITSEVANQLGYYVFALSSKDPIYLVSFLVIY